MRRGFIYSQYADKAINVGRIISIDFHTSNPLEFAMVTYTGAGGSEMVAVGVDVLEAAELWYDDV